MKFKNDEEMQIYAMAAAKFRSDGLLQSAIAKKLGITQPEVSRLLGQAEGFKWLEPVPPQFHAPAEDKKHLWEAAQTKFFGCPDVYQGLKALERGGSILQRVTLVHSTDETFRDSIVDVIQERISRVKIVGVTWGRTISGLVSLLHKRSALLTRSHHPIQFVPLCGEPLKDRVDPRQYSSSALAAQLNDVFNGLRHEPLPPSLAGVPAFVPLRFDKRTKVDDAEIKIIRRFIRHMAGYAAVFGAEEDGDPSGPKDTALADRVEAILTSVGVAKAARRGIFLSERVELGDLTEEEVDEWVVGDIGGVIVPRRRFGEVSVGSNRQDE